MSVFNDESNRSTAFAWSLESIESGETHNIIKVDQDVAAKAKLALERMLQR